MRDEATSILLILSKKYHSHPFGLSASARHKSAFSLVEALIALAVVALAVVALVRLHLQTLNLADQTRSLYHAAAFAQNKLEHTLAQPAPVSASGLNSNTPHKLHWNINVKNAPVPTLQQPGPPPLRRIDVTASWPTRNQTKQLTLTAHTTQSNTP